jgi:hypothetical protein
LIVEVTGVNMNQTARQNHRFDRWMYRGARPNRRARGLNAFWAKLASAGISPSRMVTLRVPGRCTGQSVALPLVEARYHNERYLVSMLGQRANWVRNVQAANGDVTLEHGRREQVHLVEVDPAERAPILRRYLEVAPGARAHIPVDRKAPVEDFAEISAQFPVFRINPVGSAAKKGS